MARLIWYGKGHLYEENLNLFWKANDEGDHGLIQGQHLHTLLWLWTSSLFLLYSRTLGSHTPFQGPKYCKFTTNLEKPFS